MTTGTVPPEAAGPDALVAARPGASSRAGCQAQARPGEQGTTLADTVGLPADTGTALRAALMQHPETRALAAGTLAAVEGGFSNPSWRLDAAGRRWFARLGNPQVESRGVDRASECRLLQVVAAAGLAPPVLACEPATGLLVTRWIEPAQVHGARLRRFDDVRRMGARLARLHSLPVDASIRPVDYRTQARSLAALLPAGEADARPFDEQAARVFDRLAARERRVVLCHNDLNPANIVDDGAELWLVDWEYGGRGDALLDVAGFLTLHHAGPAATEAFLEGYGRLAACERDRLADARWAFDYVQWLWYRSLTGPLQAAARRRARRLALRLRRCDN